jgi:hypothetical protein
MLLRTVTRRAAAAAFALAAVGAAACGDDPASPDADVEIESVRLTVTPATGAAATYTVTANTGGTVTVPLRVGTATIRAEPLDDDGVVVSEASEFELRLLDLPGGVTFTPNGTLTATVTTTAALAATEVSAQMWHKAENHEDFRARFRLSVTP